MENVLEDAVPLAGVICTIGMPMLLAIIAVTISLKAKHKERMALIAKGMTLKEFETEARPNRYPALRKGLLMIGLALGAFIGLVWAYPQPMCEENPEWLALFITAFSIFFGGVSLVVYYFLARYFMKKEKAEDQLPL